LNEDLVLISRPVVLLSLSFLFLAVIIAVQSFSYTLAQKPYLPASCNCVVFRMDDIQDNYVDNAQIAAMNLFLSKNQPLSLAIIMNEIGEDLRIVGKVGEGSQTGLFELAIHGWDHVDYTKLSESEQKSTLQMANQKMMKIFGNTSDIFVQPYGYFNNDTIKAMEELEIRILSAATFSENNFDEGRSIFNYTDVRLSSSTENESSLNAIQSIYHVPAMVSFKGYENSRPVKVPLDEILSTVDDNIKRYGYSVIVFHPQDFMYTDENGRIIDDSSIDSTEFQDFTRLVDSILSKNIRITTLSEIVGIEPRIYSYFG
jgi:peptidoglycan/xylan/chitin deacetylase (PgdA/CDA1 family)